MKLEHIRQIPGMVGVVSNIHEVPVGEAWPLVSSAGSLHMVEILKAYREVGFTGPMRPDHGRTIWGEIGKPGYGLYERALGATYLNGIWEALTSVAVE